VYIYIYMCVCVCVCEVEKYIVPTHVELKFDAPFGPILKVK